MPPARKFSREEIVHAALNLVRQGGMEALTARALAQALHCSACPIFTVFESMEALKQAVIRAAKDVYSGYLREGERHPLPFKGVGLAYIRFAREERELFKLLFMTGDQEQRELKRMFLTLDENRELILSLVQRITGLDEARANQLYLYCWMFSHSIATLLATGVCEMAEAEISDMLTDVFQGMLKQIRQKQEEEA